MTANRDGDACSWFHLAVWACFLVSVLRGSAQILSRTFIARKRKLVSYSHTHIADVHCVLVKIMKLRALAFRSQSRFIVARCRSMCICIYIDLYVSMCVYVGMYACMYVCRQ